MTAVPRISVAWLLVLVILGVMGFFAYHILTASSADPVVARGVVVNSFDHDDRPALQPVVAYNKPEPPVYVGGSGASASASESFVPDLGQRSLDIDAPVVQQQMPVVAGQTEADLRATRPVMETPPPVEYADPTAHDTSAEPSYFESEFGDNLRHPEQTMEIHPPMGSMRVPAAGLGSDIPMPDPIRGGGSTLYSPELAQNGGEFMKGIMAFDGMDSGMGFSSI